MRKNKKSQKARRRTKLLKRLEMKALSEGDLHLSKTVGPNENHEDGLHAEDAPSSQVANRARKNTNLTVSSLRRDVRQLKDTASSEIKEKLSDFEKKMMVQIHALFNTSMRNEEAIEDMKKFMASQETHASQQAREMTALRLANHRLRMDLVKEKQNRMAVEIELRRDMEKIAQNHKAALKETMDSQRKRLRRPVEKVHKGRG
ncbi:hypothetical protein K4K52_002158 [Colletotrichum sp. SAR 10_76]|nr:hypothetical protein K4K52_002158 [Colletotrichum sp. SAR 10_76]